jgi:tetratricopeptide (TPR) repeat protein
MMRRRRFLGAILATFLAVAMPVVSFPGSASADGGPSEERKTPGRAEDPDYAAAVKAIKAGEFSTAIRLLEGVVARDGRSADSYNWLAYATRRNGNPAAAISIYQKALAIDPKHRGAHEYIGEAYLALDDLARAKEHLARLRSLCFFPCEEYSDLKRAVEAYEKSGGTVKPAAAR